MACVHDGQDNADARKIIAAALIRAGSEEAALSTPSKLAGGV